LELERIILSFPGSFGFFLLKRIGLKNRTEIISATDEHEVGNLKKIKSSLNSNLDLNNKDPSVN